MLNHPFQSTGSVVHRTGIGQWRMTDIDPPLAAGSRVDKVVPFDAREGTRIRTPQAGNARSGVPSLHIYRRPGAVIECERRTQGVFCVGGLRARSSYVQGPQELRLPDSWMPSVASRTVHRAHSLWPSLESRLVVGYTIDREVVRHGAWRASFPAGENPARWIRGASIRTIPGMGPRCPDRRRRNR